jgi:hypothetical protein
VPIIVDTTAEPMEPFVVNLFSAANATIVNSQAVGAQRRA